MKNILKYAVYSLLSLALIFSSSVWALEANQELVLANAPVNIHDLESIKRGAKFFSTNCITCHTMIYLRYNKIAQDAGITYDRMPVNVKKWPYDVTPPDLSSIANIRGVDWIYTYLHSFYQDKNRPTGSNNLLVPDTAMPDMVLPFQGEQELVNKPISDFLGHYQWYDLVKLTKQGTMAPEQFDAMITDLVNFLAYAAEPYRIEQEKIGWWVLGFLFIFFILIYLLKKEYWKDVKINKGRSE